MKRLEGFAMKRQLLSGRRQNWPQFPEQVVDVAARTNEITHAPDDVDLVSTRSRNRTDRMGANRST